MQDRHCRILLILSIENALRENVRANPSLAIIKTKLKLLATRIEQLHRNKPNYVTLIRGIVRKIERCTAENRIYDVLDMYVKWKTEKNVDKVGVEGANDQIDGDVEMDQDAPSNADKKEASDEKSGNPLKANIQNEPKEKSVIVHPQKQKPMKKAALGRAVGMDVIAISDDSDCDVPQTICEVLVSATTTSSID